MSELHCRAMTATVGLTRVRVAPSTGDDLPGVAAFRAEVDSPVSAEEGGSE